MSYDQDYGPYRGHPSDPRYDDSEDVARDKWECEEPYIEKIGPDAIEEILHELQHGQFIRARSDLIKAIDAAWEQYKKESEDDNDNN